MKSAPIFINKCFHAQNVLNSFINDLKNKVFSNVIIAKSICDVKMTHYKFTL